MSSSVSCGEKRIVDEVIERLGKALKEVLIDMK
jgi:hypothetical protein